jgi:hypothetical protein
MSAGDSLFHNQEQVAGFKLAVIRLAAAKIPAGSRARPPSRRRYRRLAAALPNSMHFASAAGWQPTDISDSYISRFAHHLSDVIYM